MAPGTAMPTVMAAAPADVVPPRVSVTLKLNEPVVVTLLLGTNVRLPPLMSLARIVWPAMTLVVPSFSVPFVGNDVMVTLFSGSLVTSAVSE